MSKDFYDLCYDQYKREMDEADRIYQKAGIMLVAIPLLSTIAITLGRIDIVKSSFVRIDIFIYYLALLVAIVSLAFSVYFLFKCIYPCQYATLANMNVWHKWREDYQNYLKNGKESDKANNFTESDLAMLRNICTRLVEAQPKNAEINERRRKAFQLSVMASGIALVAIAVQAFFYLILKIQGV